MAHENLRHAQAELSGERRREFLLFVVANAVEGPDDLSGEVGVVVDRLDGVFQVTSQRFGTIGRVRLQFDLVVETL